MQPLLQDLLKEDGVGTLIRTKVIATCMTMHLDHIYKEGLDSLLVSAQHH